MFVNFGLNKPFMLIEFVFDVFEFLLFLQFKNGDTILQLMKVTIGLIELMPKFPTGKRRVHKAIVNDAFFFHDGNK